MLILVFIKNIKMKNKLIRYAFLLLGSLCLWNCTKEEDVTEVVTDQTKNKILSYKITNPGQKQAIYSAVDNETKTITAYLPAYYQLELMEVAIELPQGTTISPSASELVPVFTDKPFEYTVTASDGTTSKYKLNVVIQYPEMALNELSRIRPTTGAVVAAKIGQIITVTGANLIASGAVTKLYILDKDGKKVWGSYSMNELNSSSISLRFDLAANHDPDAYKTLTTDKTTQYWLQVECYGIIKKMTLPVTFQ